MNILVKLLGVASAIALVQLMLVAEVSVVTEFMNPKCLRNYLRINEQ